MGFGESGLFTFLGVGIIFLKKFPSFSSLYVDQSKILEYVCNSISLHEITHSAYGNYQLLRSEFE